LKLSQIVIIAAMQIWHQFVFKARIVDIMQLKTPGEWHFPDEA
jgi:hypothetical protein